MLLTRFTAILVAAPRYCCCCCVLALCGLWGSVANDFTTFYGIVRCIRNKVSFHFIFLREHRENIVNKSQSNDSTNCKLLAAVWQPQVASNYNAVSHILNYEINRNLSGNFNLPAGGRQAGKGGGIKAAWLLICKQLWATVAINYTYLSLHLHLSLSSRRRRSQQCGGKQSEHFGHSRRQSQFVVLVSLESHHSASLLDASVQEPAGKLLINKPHPTTLPSPTLFHCLSNFHLVKFSWQLHFAA